MWKKSQWKNVTENDYQLAELVKKLTNSESHYQLAEFVKYFTINDNDSHYPTLWKIEQWKNFQLIMIINFNACEFLHNEKM